MKAPLKGRWKIPTFKVRASSKSEQDEDRLQIKRTELFKPFNRD